MTKLAIVQFSLAHNRCSTMLYQDVQNDIYFAENKEQMRVNFLMPTQLVYILNLSKRSKKFILIK